MGRRFEVGCRVTLWDENVTKVPAFRNGEYITVDLYPGRIYTVTKVVDNAAKCETTWICLEGNEVEFDTDSFRKVTPLDILKIRLNAINR